MMAVSCSGSFLFKLSGDFYLLLTCDGSDVFRVGKFRLIGITIPKNEFAA